MRPEELKHQFMGWQCRIRQYCVRTNQGQPTLGMRPCLKVRNQEVGPINVQLVKTDGDEITREFKFLIQKTQDPAERYARALTILSEYYYQTPGGFEDELTAVYSCVSELAGQIVQAGKGILSFSQGNQRYILKCRVRDIPRKDPRHQATYWHNRVFNKNMPGIVKILGFHPLWELSTYQYIN